MDTSFEILSLDQNTVKTEGICCAFSDKKHQQGVHLKQEWLTARFAEGLKYQRLNVRGKVFIEYIPAEYAWSPIEAPGYMFIHCFWVSGRYKGQGWGAKLLETCLADSQDKNGVVVVTTKKNMPFFTEKSFFLKKGFEVCDTAPPYFELLVKPLKDAPLPGFRANAKMAACKNTQGFTFLYSDLCPFAHVWVDYMLDFAEKHGIPAQKIHIAACEEAQNVPSASALFSIFYNGKFVSHEIMNERRFEKLVQTLK